MNALILFTGQAPPCSLQDLKKAFGNHTYLQAQCLDVPAPLLRRKLADIEWIIESPPLMVLAWIDECEFAMLAKLESGLRLAARDGASFVALFPSRPTGHAQAVTELEEQILQKCANSFLVHCADPSNQEFLQSLIMLTGTGLTGRYAWTENGLSYLDRRLAI